MTKTAKIIIAVLAALLLVSLVINIVGIKNVETINLVQDDATIKETTEQELYFLNSQIEAQFEQNKELEEKNKKLLAENERLNKLVDEAKIALNQPGSRSDSQQQKVQEEKNTDSQHEETSAKATNEEAKKTAEAIIAQLDKMINFKFDVSKIGKQGNARIKASREAKAKIRNKAIEYCANLNTQTGGKFFSVIKAVKDQLSDPAKGETDCMLVAPDKDGKSFISPVKAKGALEDMKKTITVEIINKL